MLLIGDVHGKRKQYRKRIRGYKGKTVQIGDFGFGEDHYRHLKWGNTDQHKVLFGNHDDYSYVDREHSLGHFGMYEEMFFVRGAYSIDKWARTEGVSWWREEEMEYYPMLECFHLYQEERPRIVISHDCPQFLAAKLVSLNGVVQTRTRQLLQNMWEAHQPDLWVFGHHHMSYTGQFKNTTFRCLDELETFEIPDEYVS